MSLEATATFIGHNDCYGITENQVKDAIRELIEKGVTDFLSGGQGGFDRLCGRCVYELKREYPQIKNYLVIPYLSFCVYKYLILTFLFLAEITLQRISSTPSVYLPCARV